MFRSPIFTIIISLHVTNNQLNRCYFQHLYLSSSLSRLTYMKIKLLVVGKTNETYLREGITIYCNRIARYCDFELEVIPDVKNRAVLPVEKLKASEGDQILKRIAKNDHLILLDDKGIQETSEGFSQRISKWQVNGISSLVFVIGGAYGFGEEVYERADLKFSLSRLTYSHQMVRLIFLEQLYRAFTILRNEPYHHS
jgi:23S rRNA (pseudouridine1915-N3)-methyltransferase